MLRIYWKMSEVDIMRLMTIDLSGNVHDVADTLNRLGLAEFVMGITMGTSGFCNALLRATTYDEYLRICDMLSQTVVTKEEFDGIEWPRRVAETNMRDMTYLGIENIQVPDIAKYLATDMDGEVWWYTDEPVMVDEHYTIADLDHGMGFTDVFYDGEVLWYDSVISIEPMDGL